MLQREHFAILSTCIKLTFIFKTFVLSIFEWPLKTGFTVCTFFPAKLLLTQIADNSTQKRWFRVLWFNESQHLPKRRAYVLHVDQPLLWAFYFFISIFSWGGWNVLEAESACACLCAWSVSVSIFPLHWRLSDREAMFYGIIKFPL